MNGFFHIFDEETLVSQDDQFLIRRCRSEDLDKVYEIERKSFVDYWPKYSLDYVFRLGSEGFFVAEKNGEVVGYAIVTIERTLLPPWKRYGHLLNIAVDPLFRRRGIGKELIEMVVNYLRDKKIEKIVLEVRASNTVARNLYISLGFTENGIKSKYYGDEDAIVMVKEINAIPKNRTNK